MTSTNQTGTDQRFFTPPHDRPPHNRVALTSGGHAHYFPDGRRELHNGWAPARYARRRVPAIACCSPETSS